MAVKIPDATLDDLLIAAQIHPSAQRIALFKNDYTPVAGSAWGDFTECDFPGYARQTPTWGTPSIVTSEAQSVGSEVTFTYGTPGAAQNCYGWVLIDTTPGTPLVIAANRFTGAPLTVSANGDFIKVQLTETLKQY